MDYGNRSNYKHTVPFSGNPTFLRLFHREIVDEALSTLVLCGCGYCRIGGLMNFRIAAS